MLGNFFFGLKVEHINILSVRYDIEATIRRHVVH